MALSTQKGCSFYAFKASNKHLWPIRGHVGERNIQEREQNSERERER